MLPLWTGHAKSSPRLPSPTFNAVSILQLAKQRYPLTRNILLEELLPIEMIVVAAVSPEPLLHVHHRPLRHGLGSLRSFAARCSAAPRGRAASRALVSGVGTAAHGVLVALFGAVGGVSVAIRPRGLDRHAEGGWRKKVEGTGRAGEVFRA